MEIRKNDEVQTADGFKLGAAMRIHHRQNEVSPALKLYASYLEVHSLELGTSYYLPTSFIDDYDPDAGRVTLSVEMATVLRETWNRMPSFVAGGLDVPEELS